MSRISVRKLLAFGVLLSVLALGIAIETWSMEQKAAAISVQASRIDNLVTVRDELHDHVLAARAGLELSFDDINRSLLGLHGISAVAAQTRQLGAPYTVAADELELASEAQRREEAAVEVFKTDLALLRLSSQYFPIAADLLMESAADHSTRTLAAQHGTLRALRTDLERYGAAPSNELAQRIEANIALLSTLEADAAASADLSVMLGHARVILDRKERTDNFVRKISSSASGVHLKAARSAHALAAPRRWSASELLGAFAGLFATLGLVAFGGATFRAFQQKP